MSVKVLADLYAVAETGNNLIADVATGATFDFGGRSHVYCPSVAAGTKKLPDAGPGTEAIFKAAGSVTLTNSLGVTIQALTTGLIVKATAVSRTSAGVTTWTSTSLNGQEYTTLTTTLGAVPIPLWAWREVVSNDTAALATAGTTGSGGVLATDTTPTLEYRNGDTDSSLRILWATSNVDPLVTQVMIPFDADLTQPILFKAMGLMSGTSNTPVLSLDTYFRDGGGSVTAKIEDDTAAFSDAVEVKTATIAAADIPSVSAGTPLFATIEITPGAHATDTLTLYGTYLQYTKKLLAS